MEHSQWSNQVFVWKFYLTKIFSTTRVLSSKVTTIKGSTNSNRISIYSYSAWCALSIFFENWIPPLRFRDIPILVSDVPYNQCLKIRFNKIQARIRNRVPSNCFKFILILENHICLAIDHFCQIFPELTQILLPLKKIPIKYFLFIILFQI